MKLKYILVGVILIGIAVFLIPPNSTSKEFPEYAYTDPMALSGYKFASEHPEIMTQIDCYCGCYEHSGHANLRDCYIFQGVYTSHASFCDMCKALAQKTQKGINEGKTTLEINSELKEYYT